MAKDPYQYFRVEAREILDGLGRGVLQLETGERRDGTAGLLRLAHTLKGAARVVKQSAIAEHAHAIEDALGPLREGDGPVPAAAIDRLLGLVDGISAALATLGAPAPAEPNGHAKGPASAPAPRAAEGAAPRADELVHSARAASEEMDALLDGIAETAVHLRGMRRTGAAAARAHHVGGQLADSLVGAGLGADGARGAGGLSLRTRALLDELRALTAEVEQGIAGGVDRAERQVREVRDAAERLRLIPAASLFPSLERTARDAAHAQGKEVVFEGKGGATRLDAPVLAVVQGALVQMVRNAVAHGIELPGERAAAGKAPRARVEISVERRGGRVAFVCGDDGRGIDVEAVRRVAEARGLIAPGASPLDADTLLRLLLSGGLTTSAVVTELSGRGIGLDIVRDAAARLGGQVAVTTERGQGTRVELVVPVSLASLDALLVEAGGLVAAVPLDAVRSTARLTKGDVARAGGEESIVDQGQAIPLVSLATLLGGGALRARDAHGTARTAIIVAAAAGRVAVGVDAILGAANVVVRPLPSLAPADRLVAGAALDADGTPQLVLDPTELVASRLRAARGAATVEARPPVEVLVIDDSLTTRMLEQSILESAGYIVDLATSAEEGLEKARRHSYHLFLVDVEMPGMDGFTFVERTRADAILGRVPAILVSSRNAPEDLRRGADAGASAYMVKTAFDQSALLETIRKLVG